MRCKNALFTFTSLEKFVPPDRSLRGAKTLVDDSLRSLNGLFDDLYAGTGRASVAPEKLLRALLLQVFFGALRADAHGADPLQHAVPLVRRAGDRRRGVGPLGVLEEP
jgi:hypothetical protein